MLSITVLIGPELIRLLTLFVYPGWNNPSGVKVFATGGTAFGIPLYVPAAPGTRLYDIQSFPELSIMLDSPAPYL